MNSEPDAPSERAPIARDAKRVWKWNRRIHYLLGLYFLLFIWLFAISGLVLNHGKWEFANFWPDRQESTATRPIVVPGATGDLTLANDLMRQLGLVGEVNGTEWSAEGGEFAFRVRRPGHVYEVDADLGSATAEVKEVRVNVWGVMSALHSFTGVSMGDSEQRRDWWLTTIWIVAMDAIALGLILLVASGIYLAYHVKQKRALSAMALAAGTLCCGFFLFGLGLL